MKRYIVSITVDTSENVILDDVEWAVRDLFSDDERGNSNFTIGRVCGITAEEIKTTDWCHCKDDSNIEWDGFGGGKCKICGGDTF